MISLVLLLVFNERPLPPTKASMEKRGPQVQTPDSSLKSVGGSLKRLLSNDGSGKENEENWDIRASKSGKFGPVEEKSTVRTSINRS